mgnify:CR=1 FL=1
MPDISVEQIILVLGYVGIFLMMISNGLLSFPSSQILYIIAGYFIFTGDLNLVLVSLVGALGNTIGNIGLYEIARSKGLKYITKWQLFPPQIVRKVQVGFEKRGAWFVFVGKLIPALKVFVPIPAGIAKMNRVLYATIIFISSAIWTIPFISIGFFFGKSSDVFGKYAIVLIFVALIVAGLFYKYINSEEVVSEIEGG